MANDFKVAAERKKRMTAVRTAEKTIEKIEEFQKEQGPVLGENNMSAVNMTVDKLKETIKDNDQDSAAINNANQAAEDALSAALDMLEKQKAREEAVLVAEKTIEKMEAFQNEQGPILGAENMATVDAATAKLKEVIKDTNFDAEAINAANQEAEEALGAGWDMLEKLAEQKAREEAEARAAAAAAQQATVLAAAQSEAPANALEQNGAPVGERKEKISEALRRLYAAPIYSRISGETKTRFSASIKPSLKEKMAADQAAGKIKSPNDLINVLLEIYYGDE